MQIDLHKICKRYRLYNIEKARYEIKIVIEVRKKSLLRQI